MKKIGNYFFPDTDTHFERWVLDGEYQKKQRDELFLKMNSIKPFVDYRFKSILNALEDISKRIS